MQTIARKYSYDNIGQLKTAQAYEAYGVTLRQHEQLGFAYDAAWNLSQRTNNALGQSFGVDAPFQGAMPCRRSAYTSKLPASCRPAATAPPQGPFGGLPEVIAP
jgi:hypothetical protein